MYPWPCSCKSWICSANVPVLPPTCQWGQEGSQPAGSREPPGPPSPPGPPGPGAGAGLWPRRAARAGYGCGACYSSVSDDYGACFGNSLDMRWRPGRMSGFLNLAEKYARKEIQSLRMSYSKRRTSILFKVFLVDTICLVLFFWQDLSRLSGTLGRGVASKWVSNKVGDGLNRSFSPEPIAWSSCMSSTDFVERK